MKLNDNGQPASIWDGWEKQCFGSGTDFNGGFCARVFPATRFWADRIMETEQRVGLYIQQHYSVPVTCTNGVFGVHLYPATDVHHAIIYANDCLKLTPDDFRRIDRLTAMEEMARKLVESAEGTEVPKEAECALQS